MVKQLIISTLVILITNLASIQAQGIHLEYIAIDSNQVGLANTGIQPSTHTAFQSLIDERRRNLNILHKAGYLEAHHQKLEKKNDSTFTSYIYLGSKTRIAAIKLKPMEWPKEITNNIALNQQDQLTIPFYKLESEILDIQAKWRNEGYSFAQVQLENLTKNKDTLFGDLIVNKNELRKIDSITIKGYKDFPVKILRHQFGLKPNKRLNQKTIQEASQTMEATGIAKETRKPEILYEKDKSTVFLYFEKSNNNYFDGLVGFATNEESGKLEFSGNLDLSLHNNLNKGEKLIIRYQADGGEQQELQIGLETPYIANSPISVSGGIQIFKKDSTYTNTDLNAKIRLNKINWAYYLGYEQNQSVNQLQENTVNNKITSLDGKFFLIGSTYIHYQNNRLQPIGSYADVNIGTGKRETELQSESQIKLKAEGYHNIAFGKNHSLYAKAMFSKLWSKTYFANELFRVGGMDNIRGFNENSIDASQAVLIQAEYRYRLSSDIHIHTISDMGWIKNDAQNSKDTLLGLGFGIGIYSKIGMMRVQIANGLTSKDKLDFDKTRIHIALHTKF